MASEQTITISRSDETDWQEPTSRLFRPHPAQDDRPVTVLQATLHGLALVDDPEHGGLILCTPDGEQVWSIAKALAMGRMTI
jgi:hypothetical protein